ncbi:MAG: universal stress protein [Gammaproteobacteria bacterium]|nr:universal stress protein [Gammaproteobacteria bacterium]
MYKNILIATDGSECAQAAFNHGIDLARSMKSNVTVVTVTELWSALDMAQKVRGGDMNPIKEYEKHEDDIANKVLSTAEEIINSHGLKCELIHISDKHPADGIIDTAQEKGCDLIVMASHGRRGLQKILLGSIASEVLSNSTIPVLIVRK